MGTCDIIAALIGEKMKTLCVFVLFISSAAAQAGEPSAGSRVVTCTQGEILTKSHVVEGCPRIAGHFISKSSEAAVLVTRDQKSFRVASPELRVAVRTGARMQSSLVPVLRIQAAAAIAQKAVLYEEDPTDPNGKRFAGSAIWRTETVTAGEIAIRAYVEVPERKLTMTWSLRRNMDKTLPASHAVELIFNRGEISNVPGILMKETEQARGVPLAGLAMKVADGFFLIGLSGVDADKKRNLQLLKDLTWFDIPLVYNGNRRALLAVGKGMPGERAFVEAFKFWNQ
jgi:hypothetical protein